MSHLARAALLLWVAAAACCAPKPPEGGGPEVPSASSGPDGAVEPAPLAPVTAAVEPNASPTVGDAPVEQRLYVGGERVDCQAEAPMKCLQVRQAESEPWRNLYAPIEGFQHEDGYSYELRVEVTPVPSPPADGSSLRYRLLEVISKSKAGTAGAVAP